MNDLLQRLSASGEKIGVTCRQVWEGNERDWHIEHFGLRLSARVVNEPDKLNGDATMLLKKALEAKLESLLSLKDYGPYLDVMMLLEQIMHKHWKDYHFEAVLKATVEVVEGAGECATCGGLGVLQDVLYRVQCPDCAGSEANEG